MDFIEKCSLKLAENFSKCNTPDESSCLIQQYIHDMEISPAAVDLPWHEGNAFMFTASGGIQPVRTGSIEPSHEILFDQRTCQHCRLNLTIS